MRPRRGPWSRDTRCPHIPESGFYVSGGNWEISTGKTDQIREYGGV